MPDVGQFGVWIVAVPAAIILAVLSSRLSVRIRVPAPALFLVIAAIVAAVFPQAHDVPASSTRSMRKPQRAASSANMSRCWPFPEPGKSAQRSS